MNLWSLCVNAFTSAFAIVVDLLIGFGLVRSVLDRFWMGVGYVVDRFLIGFDYTCDKIRMVFHPISTWSLHRMAKRT